MPTAIQWSPTQSWINSEPEDEEIWRVVENKKGKKNAQSSDAKVTTQKRVKQYNSSAFVTAKGTTALKTVSDDKKPVKKRKRNIKEQTEQSTPSKSKKAKIALTNPMVPDSNWGLNGVITVMPMIAYFRFYYRAYIVQGIKCRKCV